MIEKIYEKIREIASRIVEEIIPYLRRILRFLALPYCYFKLVNWNECPSSRIRVASDLLYIFFRLRYFPYNYSPCRLWTKDRKEWRYYYGSIYEPYQRKRLSREVQRREYLIIFGDKEICYNLCHDAGLPLPKQYGAINPNDDYKGIIKSILQNNKNHKLIIKPVRGAGGKDILTAYIKGGNIIIQGGNRELDLNDIEIVSRMIIQESVTQHERLSHIYPSSVNTVRIPSFLTNEKEVIILGADIRFGRNDSIVDNISSGGLGVGIDLEKGTLKEFGHDSQYNVYSSHPDTGITFLDYTIPYWDSVIAVAKKTQLCFPYYRLLGPDIAVTKDGPVIIEINAEPDIVALEQKYGPILSNPKVREEFRKSDLLVNKML